MSKRETASKVNMMNDFPDAFRNDFFTDEPSEEEEKNADNTPFLFGENDQIDEVLQSYDNIETYGIYEDTVDTPEETVEETGDGRGFLGMTPIQRFILSVMIFLMTVILGAFFLILTGKVVLPFF